MSEEVRVRFPPSPTGYLHIGGARTALYNWLFARQKGGKLVLRIEDTDEERSTQASIDGIINGMKWLNLDWDEGPYFQTEFTHEHRAAAQKLLERGLAYKCFCTKEELEKKRERALAEKRNPGYDGHCRNLSPEDVARREAEGQPCVIRFKVPRRPGILFYDDKVLGRIERAYSDIEDFVIVRSNGQPLYLLCNVVDDIRDRITHVIRGQDHMTNTTRQVLLYEALEAPLPVFAHIPLTLDTKKEKISKRKHGEIVAVQFYEERGFLPWALCNFLALLGWNPGTEQEYFTREEMIKAFSLERINKANSVFNYKAGDQKFFTDPKLIAMNEQYLRSLPPEELAALARPVLEKAGIWSEDYAEGGSRRDWYVKTLVLTRDRFHTLNDFATLGRAYFADDFMLDEKTLQKRVLKEAMMKAWLPELGLRIGRLADFTGETAEQLCRDMETELSVKPGTLMNAMRTVLTGQAAGPPMLDLLATLGKETICRRLAGADHLFAASPA